MAKRVFDLIIASLSIVVLAPFLLLISLAIKITSPGPIFYLASRIGKDENLFKLYKFRTMVVEADQLGPGVTGASDNRITPLGRFLRRTKLDELPQFFNVLKGDMSLVGPRPEDPRYIAYYSLQQKQVLKVRPGITSLASVQYRHEEKILIGENWEELYIKEVIPAKLAIDLEYISQMSLKKDVAILIQTFLALFK